MKSLLLMIYSNRPFYGQDLEYLKLSSSFHDMFYKFNTTKLAELLKIKEFSVLVHHYLNNSNILSLISKRAVNQLNQEAFEFYIEDIKRICSENMDFER